MLKLGAALVGVSVLLLGATAATAGPDARKMDFIVDNAAGANRPVFDLGHLDALRRDLAMLATDGLKIPALMPGTGGQRGNVLLSVVSGNRNEVLARQIGTAQFAAILVKGNGNDLALSQSGTGNSAALVQKGNRNSLSVIQSQ